MKIRHDPPVPPVSKSFESNANDEEQRRRLPPRWPHKSGEKRIPETKQMNVKAKRGKPISEAVGKTVIYTKNRKGGVVMKTIPQEDGQSLDCKA